MYTIEQMEELGYQHGRCGQKPQYPFVEGYFPDFEDAYATAFLYGLITQPRLLFWRKGKGN